LEGACVVTEVARGTTDQDRYQAVRGAVGAERQDSCPGTEEGCETRFKPAVLKFEIADRDVGFKQFAEFDELRAPVRLTDHSDPVIVSQLSYDVSQQDAGVSDDNADAVAITISQEWKRAVR
jgi:hypothetical protein